VSTGAARKMHPGEPLPHLLLMLWAWGHGPSGYQFQKKKASGFTYVWWSLSHHDACRGWIHAAGRPSGGESLARFFLSELSSCQGSVVLSAAKESRNLGRNLCRNLCRSDGAEAVLRRHRTSSVLSDHAAAAQAFHASCVLGRSCRAKPVPLRACPGITSIARFPFDSIRIGIARGA